MFNVYILARKSVPEVEEEDLDETEKQFKIQSLPSHLQLLHALLQVRYSSVIKLACLLHVLHISLYYLSRVLLLGTALKCNKMFRLSKQKYFESTDLRR